MKLTPVKSAENISSEAFISNHMKACKPIILKDFIEQNSPAYQKWNYEYFKEIAGETKVNVYGSELESIDRVASKPVAETTFSEYLDLISTKTTEYRLFLFNLLSIKPELKDDLHYRDVTKGKVLKWLPFMFFWWKRFDYKKSY